MQVLLSMKEVVGCEGIDLLSRLLELDPEKRINAKQALQHPFLIHNSMKPSQPNEAPLKGYSSFLKGKQEAELMSKVNALDREIQRDVNERMRVILVDWLTDVAEHFKLNDRTFQLCVSYLNQYLSTVHHVPRSKFQLIGVCCLKLADCFNERSREFYRMMTSTEYSHMTANEFSREEVVAVEKEIAKAIDYQFDTCTATEAINMSMMPSKSIDSTI